MTEQEKTSAVVEETREAVDTTSQPVATEKKSKNNTAYDFCQLHASAPLY